MAVSARLVVSVLVVVLLASAVGAIILADYGSNEKVPTPNKLLEGLSATFFGEPSYGATNSTANVTSMEIGLNVLNSRSTPLDPSAMNYTAALSNGKTITGKCTGPKSVAPGENATITLQFDIGPGDWNSTLTTVRCSDSTGHMDVKINAIIVPQVATHWFTNLNIDGFWEAPSPVDQSVFGPSWGVPMPNPAFMNYSRTSIKNQTWYYFDINSTVQQAFVEWLKANDFPGQPDNKPNVAARWQMSIDNEDGIVPADVGLYCGHGYPSQALVIPLSNLAQIDNHEIAAKLDSVPSAYDMQRYRMSPLLVPNDFDASFIHPLTPGAIEFHRAGEYKINLWITNDLTGEVMSPTLTETVTVNDSSVCGKPWPSKISIVNGPDTMKVGLSYTFTAQMSVQNYDDNCNPTPWYYAPNTPVTWIFTNAQGQSLIYETTTASDGTCSVNFLCPSAGTWTVVAQWAGSEGYVAASASATVQAS